MSDFYLNINSVTEGPFDQEGACERLATVPPGVRVFACKKGMNSWVLPTELGLNGSTGAGEIPAPIPGFVAPGGTNGIPQFSKATRASVSARIYAYTIDAGCYIACFTPLLIGALVMPKNPPVVLLISVTIAALLVFLVYTCTMLAQTGQTIGKRMCKIRVVDKVQMRHVSGVQALVVRHVFFLSLTGIPVLGILLGIANLVLLFCKPHETIQDRMAKTIVVNV